jgi:hypothetical protein
VKKVISGSSWLMRRSLWSHEELPEVNLTREYLDIVGTYIVWFAFGVEVDERQSRIVGSPWVSQCTPTRITSRESFGSRILTEYSR